MRTLRIRTGWAALLLMGICGLAHSSWAVTINAVSCSQADVQNALNSAASGDTISVPAGNCAWAAGISFSKGIKLCGAGSGGFVGRSTSSNTIGTGAKIFTTSSGLDFQVGETITVLYLADGAINMTGTVTSYSGTGLVLNIVSTNGSGTGGVWLFMRPARTTIVNDYANNWGVGLFNITENTSASTEVSGIYFLGGTAGNGGEHIHIDGASNGKPVLIHDNRFTASGSMGRSLGARVNRGVVYKNSFDNGLCSDTSLGCSSSVTQAMVFACDAASWTTPSTMGANDLEGVTNFYFEDNYCAGFWQSTTDTDENSRVVIRHNTFDNSCTGSHGADTSTWGVRHYEIYDNTFIFDDMGNYTYNLNRWFFNRGGTGVITNNVMPDIKSQAWGDKTEIDMTVMNLRRNAGPNPCWGANIPGIQYPAPRQIGMGYVTGNGGYDSVTYKGDSEPLYIWNNTGNPAVGLSDYGPDECTNSDSTVDYIVQGRDYFLGSPKPGYAKYTYPHPLRGGPQPSAPPHSPRGLHVQ